MALVVLLGRVDDASPRWSWLKVVQNCCFLVLVLIMCIPSNHQAILAPFNKSLTFLPQFPKQNSSRSQASVTFDSPKFRQTRNENRLKYGAHGSLRRDVLDPKGRKFHGEKLQVQPQSDQGTVLFVPTRRLSYGTPPYHYGTSKMEEAGKLQSSTGNRPPNVGRKRPLLPPEEEQRHLSIFGHVPRKTENDKRSRTKSFGAFPDGNEKVTLHNIMSSSDGMNSVPGHEKGQTDSLCPPCKCHMSKGMETADCSKLRLAEIPNTLPYRLVSLNMSLNVVGIFHFTYLSMHPYLESIDFQSNRIQMFVRDRYNTSQLTSLNLRNNSVTDLRNISCKSIPKLEILILSENNISHIPSSSFQDCKHLTRLDLSLNKITSIDSSAFDSLSNLITLSLAFNYKLRYTVLTPRLFRRLHSLRHLAIQACAGKDVEYPNEALVSIAGLVELSIDGLGGGIEFGSAMNNLTHLETVNFSPGSLCFIDHISPSFFENIRRIKSVSFHLCGFSRIDPKALGVLHNLETYAISFPRAYTLIQAFDDIQGLQNNSLKCLRFAYFTRRNGPCVALTFREGRYIQHFPLEELDLRGDFLAQIEDPFLEALPKTLQILRLQRNKFSYFAPLWGGMSSFTALRLLDLSNQNTEHIVRNRVHDSTGNDFPRHISSGPVERRHGNEYPLQCPLSNQDSYFPHCRSWENHDNYMYADDGQFANHKLFLDAGEDNEEADEGSLSTLVEQETGRITIAFPPNLTTLVSSKFSYDGQNLFIFHILGRRLKEIHFSKSVLTEWGNGIMPVTIETADLSDNYCEVIRPSFIPANNSLKRLFIQGNFLGPVLTEDFNGNVFANAKRMRVLDMSQNIIFNLPRKFLKGLERLRRLVLTENKLHVIDIDFSHTPNLRFLDLKRNSIIWISRASRHELDVIGSRHTLTMDLTDNPLPCSCNGIEILQWMVSTNVHIHNKNGLTCSSQNRQAKELMGDIQRKINKLESQCASKYFVIISTFLGVLFFLIITLALLYRHRWKLIYMRNVWLVNIYGFRPMGNTPTGRVYDAYVVYSQEDRDFALDTMLEELEEKRGHRLCVEDRDFIPGSFNFNNITCAVQNSTVTLLLVSPDFVSDRELEYATQMALMEEYSGKTERDVLLLVNYRRTDRQEMSKDLLLLMRKDRFLDFPGLGQEEEEEEEMPESVIKAFWDRLSREIGHVDYKNTITPLFVNADRPAC